MNDGGHTHWQIDVSHIWQMDRAGRSRLVGRETNRDASWRFAALQSGHCRHLNVPISTFSTATQTDSVWWALPAKSILQKLEASRYITPSGHVTLLRTRTTNYKHILDINIVLNRQVRKAPLSAYTKELIPSKRNERHSV